MTVAIATHDTQPGASTAVLATLPPDFILEDPINKNVIIIYISSSRIKVRGNKHDERGIVKTLFDMLTRRFPNNAIHLKPKGFTLEMKADQQVRMAEFIRNNGWKTPIPVEKKRRTLTLSTLN